MWCQHFGPDTFLEQTAVTFAASLRGRHQAFKLKAEQDISLAWHTAAFSGAAQAGKLKKLEHYLPKAPAMPQTADDVAAIFRLLKAKGKSVVIQERPSSLLRH